MGVNTSGQEHGNFEGSEDLGGGCDLHHYVHHCWYICLSSGCYHKLPQNGRPVTKGICFSQFWSLGSSRSRCGLLSSLWESSSCWHVAVLCPHMVEGELKASTLPAGVHLLSRVWLCDPMDCRTPALPVPHYLLKFAQVHVHRVGDAIQPSHPLSPPSPLALNLSQHHSFPVSQFFASGGQSIGASASVSVLPMNIQNWFPLGLAGLISLQSKRLSSTTVWRHQFFSAQLSL